MSITADERSKLISDAEMVENHHCDFWATRPREE